MAEKDINIRIQATIEAGNSVKTMGELKQNLKDLKNLSVELGDSNPAALKKIEAAAGQSADKIGDINQRVKNLASDTKKLDVVMDAAKGIAGGFALAQGAVGLFTNDSEKMQQTLLKVNSAMAIMNGLQEVSKVLNKDSALAQSLLTTATAAYNFVLGTSTGALKLFKIALIGTGIGIAVVAVGLLVANFDKISEVVTSAVMKFEWLGETLGFIKDKIQDFLASLGLMDSVEEQNAKESIKRSNDKTQTEIDNLERLIKLKQAKGEESFNEEKALLEKKIQLAEDGSKEELDLLNELEVLKATQKKEADDEADKVQDERDKEKAKKVEEDKKAAVQKAAEDKAAAEQKAAEDKAAAEQKAQELLDWKKSEQEALDELDILQATSERDKLDEKYAQDIRDTQENSNQRLVIEEKYKQDVADLDEEEKQNKIRIAEELAADEKAKRDEQKAERERAANDAVTIATGVAGALTALNNLITVGESNNRKKSDKEDLEIKKKQFERNKALQIVGAVISTAQAIINGFNAGTQLGPAGVVMGPVMAALAGITGALQIAAIASAKFNPGGGGAGAPGAIPSAPNVSDSVSQSQQTGFNAPSFFGLGNTQEQGQGPATRVFVTESDITRTQNNVNVIESRAVYK